MKSIALAGSLAQKPGRGGHTWVFLQYLLGFKKLGWDVLWLDRLEPDMCVDAAGNASPLEGSWNVRYLHDVLCRFGLGRSFSLLCDQGRSTIGISRAGALEFVRSADALINVMGFLDDDELLGAARHRVFLDIDPGFPQMWKELGLHDAFHGHDAFVTIGENMGKPSCEIPTCGLEWITTKQPVVLDEWPLVAEDRSTRPITSIVSWRGAFGPVTYNGKTYGLRPREFRKFAALPERSGDRFRLALSIHGGDTADAVLLERNGWELVSPDAVAGDPWKYRDFIQQSAAELMVAKNMYVESRSGWISDRSICYLASGIPVLAQETGLADLIPTGAGLLTFETLDQAVESVQAIRREPLAHRQAARRLAEEYFDSSRVLDSLLTRLGLQ